MKRTLLLTILIFFAFTPGNAHNLRTCLITGNVKSSGNENLGFVNISLKDTPFGAMTDEDGNYVLRAPAGKYRLVAGMLGYGTFEKDVELNGNGKLNIDIRLEEDNIRINDVVVTGKSLARIINETAFNVVAIDAKPLHNTSLDVSNVLDRVSGVKVRESGGVGSDASLSLNGFSGRHVKFFMDGMPMEGFGSSFQINNIPVNLAERIEVYKGVVPVSFGADALGGVVNIVTRKEKNTFIDASYSYGSFNTHRSYLNFGHTTDSGFNVDVNMYQNYSDNNYHTYVHLSNEDGMFEENETKVRRFHDNYHNETVMAKLGLVGKKYAERLLFGIVLGKNRSEIQNANNQDFVYGEKFRKGTTVMPTLSYSGKDLFTENLDISLNANYNFGFSQNIDTASYRGYNWLGEVIETHKKGEAGNQLYKYWDNNGSIVFNTGYSIAESHFITLNNVLTVFRRKSEDMLASDNDDNFPRINTQNVTGLGYTYSHNETWNLNGFYKHYYKYSETQTQENAYSDFVKTSGDFSASGYGAAATWFPGGGFQIKASYEKAFRLPTDRELFGNNDLEVGNIDLKPESSDNLNLGASFNRDIGRDHNILIDAGFIYRDIHDFIRRSVKTSDGSASSSNIDRVRNMGVNFEAHYSFRNLIVAGGNLTYQNIRNKDKNSFNYNDRMPNIPYLYANGDLTLFLRDIGKKGNHLIIGYNTQYVYQFYLRWPGNGGSDKSSVPTQFSHDVNVSYSLGNGRYNITVECRNLTDERLYDNYSLQKPGRFFSGKLRYYISWK